ncbi:MAG: sensor histidine kinase [Deltaproteobacteria bacterium HGW-Deltaproteobacteria-15]|jgi:signal transduction histidine kinase|nr:MAG: sensor histidine kinase [Deltaproteobacteria bacterium HGW-Deltaproteobacteria-15]
MISSKWFIHPILIFIFSIVAVTTSLALYIYWYVEVSAGLKSVIQKANVEPGQALASQTWVVILVLSILVGLILMSIFIIFVYNQKTFQLYRLQRNFIDNFTHELKTPVTSLKLYLETFRKHTLSREDQIKYLDYMIQDAERLSDNINRILNLAKIESKAYKGEFVTRGLVSTLQEFSERNRHLFKGCEIRIHNPSGEPYAHRVDLSLFEMLLMNLLTNAVRYNHSNAPRVDITFEQRGRELHIRFEDNGIGLPRSETKRIFRKFYQVPPLENTSAKGSGVGLFLVDSIARLHKGRIMAESKGSGKGSVFSVILPLNTPASIQEAEA